MRLGCFNDKQIISLCGQNYKVCCYGTVRIGHFLLCTVSPSENPLGMSYKPAWGLWWLIAWTGWWPSAGPCNLPVSTWNYEAEGLMGFQVIEPRCPKAGCSRFHRFARLWSLSIIYFLLRYPSPIFMQSWTSQMQRPSPWHTVSREAIPVYTPAANSSDTSSLPCGPGSWGQFFC